MGAGLPIYSLVDARFFCRSGCVPSRVIGVEHVLCWLHLQRAANYRTEMHWRILPEWMIPWLLQLDDNKTVNSSMIARLF